MLVYDVDVEKDQNGNDIVVDATIIHGSQRERDGYVNGKIEVDKIGTNISTNSKTGSYLGYNNKKNNSENQYEGGILKTKISQIAELNNISSLKEFSIVRFINEDKNENAVINYNGTMNNIDIEYKDSPLVLSETTKQRLRFSGLYIEKTANVFNNTVVKLGDTIEYTINVKNNGNTNYTSFDIVENLPEYIEVIENNSGSINDNKITWNIQDLAANNSIQKVYKVKVKNKYSNLKKEIISSGTVAGIPSSTVKNMIGNNLSEEKKNALKTAYNNYTGNKNGKKFIDDIYNSIGKTLNLENFEITDLILDTNPSEIIRNTIELNEDNMFYNQILNNYYGKLQSNENYIDGDGIKWFQLKNWRYYNNYDGEKDRRADTIYKQHFQTGDILLYLNKNDVNYTYENNELKIKKVTNESGEYAYIYIEGIGFVGRNYGADKQVGTEDDRNEFNVNYYSNNGLQVYSNTSNNSIKEYANYQTLLVKDYYVILRPSLTFDITPPTITAEDIVYGENINIRLQDDDSGVVAWQVNQTETEPADDWTEITSTKDTTVTKTGLKAGTYYIWAKDEEGNVSTKSFIKINLGDLNDNGKIDSGDALKIYRYMAQKSDEQVAIKHPNWNLSEEKILQGDINKNGKIDSGDALKIERYLFAHINEVIAQKHPDWLNEF